MQSLVASLASNKAVWDAILRNVLVREFQWTPYAGFHYSHHIFGLC